MSNYRRELTHFYRHANISKESIEQALTLSKVRPDSNQWKQFISNLMLYLGVLAIASAVMFFIASNWDEMGRFAKFGLVQALIMVSISAYWFSASKKDVLAKQFGDVSQENQELSTVGQTALLIASLLLGVMLAFFGQTYQTGADTWQLFFTWAILIIPWVFIAKFPALWIIWIALLNLSAVLYFQVFGSLFNAIFFSGEELIWLILLINTTALVIWELLQNRYKWLAQSWAIRTLALVSGTSLTILVTWYIVNIPSAAFPFAPVLWLAGMALVYVVYRRRQIDLFMLAMACLSGLTVITYAAGELIFNILNADTGGFFMMAVLVILLATLSASWLKALHKESLGISSKVEALKISGANDE
ncbi:MAG: putative membrane protein [Porticoccaceae bacterium]|jgi:uncharacterized membrane protein